MKLTPLRNNVIGKLVDNYGIRTTDKGVLIVENDGTPEAIRPRWFKVTHVGPEQLDVAVGDEVLVYHGRWSRGIDFDLTLRPESMYFFLDNDYILGKK